MKGNPHIVFLDAATVDCGDVDLSPLRKIGRLVLYPHTASSQVVKRCRGADIVITNKVKMQAVHFAGLKRLRLLCLAATGFDNVDIQAARKRGVAVCNVRAYSTQSVAEQTLMFILALAHRLVENHEAAVHEWRRSRVYNFPGHAYSELRDKVLGIVGYGRIGKRVAGFAKALGMRVLTAKIPGRVYPLNTAKKSLSYVLERSDFVSLHCPLTPVTHHLINRSTLKKMRPSACLVNVARGAVVDEAAVVRALKVGHLAGYATDVLAIEPPSAGHALFQKSLRDKVLFSPHIAWASCEARQRLVGEMAKNIRAFLRGQKRHRVC